MDQQHTYKALLVIITGLLVLAWIFEWTILVYIAGATGLVSLIIPPVARLIVKGWLLLAEGLGWINSRIILGLVFYLILTPVALLSRIFTGDSLKLSGKLESIFSERNHTYTREDLKNMW